MILLHLARRLAATLLLVLWVASPALVPLAPAGATVNSTVSKTIVLGNGVTTTFNFNFVGVAAQYISVILTDSSGNETVLAQGSGTTQYQITLNAPVTGAIWGLGGTITYNPSGTPIPSGSTLTIFRTLPLTQAISLQNQNSLSRLGNGAETGLDIGVMQTQQQVEMLSRAIVAPIVDATPPAPLPPIAQRANKGAAFDGQGNLVAGTTPATGVISTAMQPVVSAATLAAGRAAFGLGAMAQEGIGAGLQDDGFGNARVNSLLVSVATNQSVDATFAQKTYVATGPINFTLARANTLWNGFSFSGVVLGNALSLVPNANDSIQGQASGDTVVIPANSFFSITADGAASGNWWISWAPWNAAIAAARGLTVTNNAGVPNTRIDVAIADVVMVNPLGYGIKAGSVALTIDLTIGTVASAPNGMDGEAIPANGDLFLWAISNGSITAGLASTSSTAPTMPTGYTFKKYIGAMKTASSILMRTLQKGRRTQYKVTPATNTANFPIITTNANNWPSSPSVAGVVPATASEIFGLIFTVASNSVFIGPNGNSATNNANNPTEQIAAGAGAGTIAMPFSFLLESNLISYGLLSVGSVACTGWVDNSI